jgi:hypothetical protein
MPSGDSSQGGTPPDGTGGGQGGAPSGGGGGANTTTFDFSGSYTGALSADNASQTSSNETYSATDSDQNAALAQNGGTLTITGDTLTKSGDDTNGDNCNFYGLNSILLSVGSSSKALVSDTKLSASSEGSNGIFATDSGTVWANNDTITTTAGNSRGLDATYGGTIVADNMTIATQGNHCAGIATDRGGGNISAANSTLNTAGSGSPLLYSTGDIEVSNVTGTATGSQIAGMEGLNSIQIYNSNLTSTITGKTASDPIADGIIIYQSTSGDAESTTGSAAEFDAVDSTLSSSITSGSMFYFTNTSANVVLSNTTLNFDSANVNLIEAAGNDSNNWGTAGSNGATVAFTGIGETLAGNIDVDTISSLDMFLTQGTTYTGATSISTNSVNTKASSAPLTMNVDATSTWVLTGDSTVTNLNAASGSKIVDAQGKTVTIKAGGQTVVTGDSSITLTVAGTYSTTVTTTDTNLVAATNIDRSGFDAQYGTSTSFGTSGAARTKATTTTSSASGSMGGQAPTSTASAPSGSQAPSTNSSSTTSSSTTTQDEGFFGWLWRTISGLFGA